MDGIITAQTTKWRIGAWIACSDTDMLLGEGAQHKLERRAMEALIVLAERAGQVVKKDEFIAAVWGRVAVSDHSVAMVISQIRRAFGDDPRAPRYIETITKRGYRLIAPCSPHVPASQARLASSVNARRAGTHSYSAVTLVSAGVALAGIGAVSAMLLF